MKNTIKYSKRDEIRGITVYLDRQDYFFKKFVSSDDSLDSCQCLYWKKYANDYMYVYVSDNTSFCFTGGADPKLKTQTGLTPLLIAIEKDQNKVVEHMLKMGADILHKPYGSNRSVLILVHRF